MNSGMGSAALATATGTTLTVLILASHFFSKDNHLKLEFSDVWRRVPEVLGNGLASFILEISNGFVMLLFNSQLLAYVGEMGITVEGDMPNQEFMQMKESFDSMSAQVKYMFDSMY